MGDLPRFVHFHEEGPREGFQIEAHIYPIEERVALIDQLAVAGLAQIQVGAFVSPRAVPAMADVQELFAAIDKRPGTRYTALWLNESGYRRAASTPNVDLDGKVIIYATDMFARQNNNCTAAEMRERLAKWVEAYIADGVPYESAYILTAFGCNYQGEVPLGDMLDCCRYALALAARHNVPAPRLYLADTVGWANPEEVKRRIGAVRDMAPDVAIGLHLHDTRGMGAANFYAALEMGVDMFDSSIAGLGGCPFADHANNHGAGNICTEDMAFMCAEMGIDTGLDLDALIEAAKLAEKIIGRPLAGKLMHAGRPRRC